MLQIDSVVPNGANRCPNQSLEKPKASKMEPKKCVRKIFGCIFRGSKMLFAFVLFWIASKTAQEGPKRP